LCFAGCYKDDLDKGTLDYYADLPSYEIFPNNCVKQCKIDGEFINVIVTRFMLEVYSWT